MLCHRVHSCWEPWKYVPVLCASLYLSILGVLPEARASIAGESE